MASFNPHKIGNKQKRQAHQLKVKKQKESAKRDERLRRRRTEDKNPRLREERRARNVPVTIDGKRTWDAVEVDEDAEGRLGLSVDILDPKKRRRVEEEPAAAGVEDDVNAVEGEDGGEEEEEEDDERDSMLDSDSEAEPDEPDDDDDNDDDDDDDDETKPPAPKDATARLPSEAPSTATDLQVTPEALMQRFPSLFSASESGATPKVLITTSINSTLHEEARQLTTIFPHSTYVRRTAHFHGHKYSVREIAGYAGARGFTCVMVLNEERRRPRGLDIVHLPAGPMFHFGVSNWAAGARIPGHGNPTNHYPELILNGFRTPLGLLTAHLFRGLFPARPEVHGRQVVTLHNQRDYIFFRRHRYVFRDRRGTEKSVQGADGRPVAGVEEIRAGLQELGPRFTLKLRRVDKGIQRASGQEWEWKAHDEKVRTRFSL